MIFKHYIIIITDFYNFLTIFMYILFNNTWKKIYTDNK